jgi:hypothetical protein
MWRRTEEERPQEGDGNKIIHGNSSAPTYLSELVRPANRSQATHASPGHNYQLAVNRTKTKYGDRSFSMSSAMLWNGLPRDLASIEDSIIFKKSLKPWLITKY